jgi:hypothetical protein
LQLLGIFDEYQLLFYLREVKSPSNIGTGVDAKKHKDKERERLMQQYFFNGHQICRKTF